MCLGAARFQIIQVNDIDIGTLANLQAATIRQAIKICIVQRLLVHNEFDRQFLATGTITNPMDQLIGRHSTINDQTDMGTGIRQANNSIIVGQHFTDDFVIALQIIRPKQNPERLAAV